MSLRPSTGLAYNLCSARATTPPSGGSGSHSLRCFGQRLAASRQFLTSIIGTVHSPAALSGGHHCQGRQAASALKSMELFSEPADVTGVGAKQDDSPSSLWLYAPGVHYRPKCPKINRKNPRLQRSNLFRGEIYECIIIEVSIRLSLQGQKVKASTN